MSQAVRDITSRAELIAHRIAEELDDLDLDDPGLRSVQVTVKLNPESRRIRTVIVNRETEG